MATVSGVTAQDPAGGLALPDALLLLALDEERGTAARSAELDQGLGGAVVLELALRQRLDVVDGKVVVTDQEPTGDPVLDGVLARVAADRRQRTPKHWVVKASKDARRAVADRLVASGVLRREERRVLGLFPVTSLPAGDRGPEAAVRARLDDAVLRGLAPDERTAALAALVHATGLARVVFPTGSREERRAVEARLAQLAEGEWAAAAVRQAVRDIESAVAAAVAVSAATGGDGSS